MIELDAQLPGYGFAQHKGYGTAAHQAALETLGVSRVHRVSFAPVKARQGERRQVKRDRRQRYSPFSLSPHRLSHFRSPPDRARTATASKS